MGLQVRDALRRLCVEIGWSYAVFWRAIGRQDQMQLVWEDGYSASPGAPPAMSGFEAMDLLLKEKAGLRSSRSDRFADNGCQADDGVSSLVYKVMANQVHVVGDGIIGRAALSGSHQWILPDSFGDYGSAPKDLADMSNQIVAGIQTIALIPVLPHGLLQLGSTQMVMENSRFINHVKSLFTQLGSHGFVADITKRPLNQNVHLSASLGMTSVNQPGDFSSYISGLSALSSARCNQLALKSPISATISQPSHSLSTQLHSRLPVDSMEMASSTTVSSKMISPTVLSQPTIVTEAEPIHRQPSQLEKGHVGAQVIYSNPDVSSIENATLQGSGSSSQHQSQILTSSLSSVHTFLEEQLMYITGSWDSANQQGSSLNNFKKPQLDAHGSKISRSARDPDIVSPFDQSRSTLNSNIIGKHCSFSGDTTSLRSWSPISSSRDIYQMLDRVDHSNSSQMLSGDPQLRHTIKESYALSSEGRRETDNILYESVHVSSTGFDEHQSFYGSQFDCQGGRMSSSNPGQESKRNNGSICIENNSGIASSKQNVNAHDQLELLPASNESLAWHESGNDFFDLFGLDNKSGPFHGILDDLLHSNDENAQERSADVSTCITQADTGFSYHGICNGLYSEASPDQLLDAVVAQMNSGVKQNMDDSSASYNNSLTTVSKSSPNNSPVPSSLVASPEQMHGEHLDLSPVLVKSEAAGSSSLLSVYSVGKTGCSVDKTGDCSQKDEGYKSQISLWVENGQSLNCDSIPAAHYKRLDEASKFNRKRSRPGENPRPRPKDRQMIQDRVKELREIVPNGAKCSIDALLEKTIKHMLFLQSVTKHADKLKEIGVPKIMNKEGGLLLKDNFEGGATWAFEVGSQSMICPIVVEDLNPPRQMLVEMLCQERGIFLEIADLIRGLGLTILKGVMEARNDKVWARFAVEANRDITRMEIFLSLVRLLEPNAGNSIVPKGAESLNMPHIFHPSSIPATGLSDHLR